MTIETQFKVGGTVYKIVVDGGKDMEMLHQSIVLSNPRTYCNLCKNAQFFAMDSNKDKDGNVYVNVVCKKCFAKAKLGQYKSGGYFWREFEQYQKEGTHPQAATAVADVRETPVDEEGMPF